MTTAVIDTMVFAYALFNEPVHRQEALAVLKKTKNIHVPDVFRAEFCNVAWQWATHQQLSLQQAIQATERAEALITPLTLPALSGEGSKIALRTFLLRHAFPR